MMMENIDNKKDIKVEALLTPSCISMLAKLHHIIFMHCNLSLISSHLLLAKASSKALLVILVFLLFKAA